MERYGELLGVIDESFVNDREWLGFTMIFCYHGKSFWITGVLMQYGSNAFVSNIAGVADNTVHG